MSVSPTSTDRPATVDAELYLRLQGERSLGPAMQAPHESPLGLIGSALVAVGLLDLDLAGAIVADYALARQLRPGGAGFPFMHQAQPQSISAPDAPVVALLRNEDPQPDGSLPYAVLTTSRAEIAVAYRGTDDWTAVAKTFPNPGNFPHSLPMADDTGTTCPAMFNGGGGNGEWSGRFVAEQPLSLSTRWLELGGRRLTLLPSNVAPEVRVEQLPATSPAADFLRHRQASSDRLPPPQADPVIEALIATGALDAEDSVLEEITQIWNAGPAVTGGVPHAMRRAMFRQFGGLPAMAAPSLGGGSGRLPPPWSNHDPQRTVSGPTGVVPIGVATPVLEGAAAVFYALTSEADGFAVDTEQFGGGAHHHLATFVVDPTPDFAWWAEDDRGAVYRGQWNGWSGSEGGRRGNIAYSPALDPGATRLRLLPTLRAHRVVVEIALPDWRDAA